MVDFFTRYIDPTSLTRAKLVVQLVAQGVSSKPVDAETKKKEEQAETSPISNGTTPVLITSVRDFKAGLAVTAGARPTHELSEFEELDSKL